MLVLLARFAYRITLSLVKPACRDRRGSSASLTTFPDRGVACDEYAQHLCILCCLPYRGPTPFILSSS